MDLWLIWWLYGDTFRKNYEKSLLILLVTKLISV